MDPFDLRLWNGFKEAGGQVEAPAIIDQVTIDSRRIYSRFALFVALKGERQDGHAYVLQAAQAGARYALVHKEWNGPAAIDSPIQLLRVANPLKAFQEIAKSYRTHLKTTIIGIAGSYGKTMVKDLLFDILSKEKRAAASPESFNSQIGVPLSLFTLRKEHEIGIIEAGISHIDEMNVLADIISPQHAILTPLGKKHVATLGSLKTVAEETMKLVLAAPGWQLIPKDSILESYYERLPSCYYWNLRCQSLPHASLRQERLVLPIPYELQFPDSTSYQGKIQTGFSYFLNLVNMAIKSAWLTGISTQSIREVLEQYRPEPMRTEIWKAPIGATFINDTYCSDPQSIDLSLRHFEQSLPHQRQIFVFGGMRGQSTYQQMDYKRIGQALSKSSIQSLILFGPKNFQSLIENLKAAAPHIHLTAFESYQEALHYLKGYVKSQDVVLIKGDSKQPLDSLHEIFHDSLSNNQCTINLAAIRSNLATLRKKLPAQTRLMVIVKALAYGTDDVQMAKFLNSCGVDILGVSYVDEGVALKRAGVTQAIFSINAAIYEVGKVVRWGLEVGVSDAEFIHRLAQEASQNKARIKVHLHINTGMSRFGCRPEEALNLSKLILSYPSLKLEGIMTHFSCSDDPLQDDFTKDQVACFDAVIQELENHGISPLWRHAANSSGSIRFYLPQYNMVRIGLAMYGLYSSEATHQALDLRLALSLTSRIVGINVCKKGESISYGRQYKVERDFQKIAVLPIGYFDGLHRNYSGKSSVLIRGHHAPMVGNICMDYMMVDITDVPDVAIGDQVLIFGEDEFGQYASPEELAMRGDSIVHELITCLGPRIQRIFVYEEGRQIR